MTTLHDDAALTAFTTLHFYGEEVEDSTWSEPLFLANPLGDFKTCWAIAVPVGSSRPHGVVEPNMVFKRSDCEVWVWYFSTRVRITHEKAYNTYRMIEEALRWALKGRVVLQVPNPLVEPENAHLRSTGGYNMIEVRQSLMDAGLFKHRFYGEARHNGGISMSEAKVAAARKNAAKAREAALAANKARGEETARKVLEEAEKSSVAEMAAAHGITEKSVEKKIARARERLSIEEMVAMFDDEKEVTVEAPPAAPGRASAGFLDLSGVLT